MNSDQRKPKIIVICGPTGVGKTSAALELARGFNGEIVSADSRQIYRYMDIGTAKPTASERARIPHHMIDIVNPEDPFDAATYAREAGQIIRKLHERRITPLVVGGTGLYIKALLHGLFPDGRTDPVVRKRLQEEAKVHGTGFLYQRLRQCDLATAQRLHPNDTFRIIRALEIYEITGQAISRHHIGHRFASTPFRTLKIGLNLERNILYERINRRVDVMIEAGLVDETKKLLQMGYSADLKSMQSLGYRHLVDFIHGRAAWDETLGTWKRDTRRYAKQQLTWFKADGEIIWRKPTQLDNIFELITEFLSDT